MAGKFGGYLPRSGLARSESVACFGVAECSYTLLTFAQAAQPTHESDSRIAFTAPLTYFFVSEPCTRLAILNVFLEPPKHALWELS